MWRSPLHQNRFLKRIKSGSSLEKKDDSVDQNRTMASLSTISDRQNEDFGINVRKRSSDILKFDTFSLNRFRRQRCSLPNNNTLTVNVRNKFERSNNKFDQQSNQKNSNNVGDNTIGSSNSVIDLPYPLPGLDKNTELSSCMSFKSTLSKHLSSMSMPSSPSKMIPSIYTTNIATIQMNNEADSSNIDVIHPMHTQDNKKSITRKDFYNDTHMPPLDKSREPECVIGNSKKYSNISNGNSYNNSNDPDEELSHSEENSTTESEIESISSLEFEDNEDLESTITKLRQLLSQQKSDENSSTDSGVPTVDIFESNNSKSHEISENPETSSLGIDCHSAFLDQANNDVDTPDAPLDGRIFYNVRITDVEVIELPRKVKSAKNTPKPAHMIDDKSLATAASLVFSICYDGIYIEESLAHINPNQHVAELASNQVTTLPKSSSFKYTLEKEHVKRKYQEFVLLQKHIENKISVNSDVWSLKDNSLKDRSSWLNSIHNKFENQKTNFCLNEMVDIQERKDYLEKWLIDICGNSTLCRSPEIKHFLSYPTDNMYGVARKSSRNAKLDKVNVLQYFTSNVCFNFESNYI